MDFVRGRTFRQTLLVHRDVRIDRQVDRHPLKSLYIASPAQPVSRSVSPGQASTQSFRAPNGATIATSNGITKAALHLLREHWPLGLTFDELVAASSKSMITGSAGLDDEKLLSGDLVRCYAADLLELRVKAPAITLTPGAFPLASAFARLQAASGNSVTNLRHEPVVLDSAGAALLQLLDGTRDRAALKAAFAERPVRASAQEADAKAAAGEAAPSIDLEQQLSRLARQALIAR
jgi:methyltransferase-like protein